MLREDLCDVMGTEFKEIMASENHKGTQKMLKSTYACNSVGSQQVSRHCVGGIGE